MAAPESAQTLTEVVPFGRLRAGELDEVLEAQRLEWAERLHWDVSEIVAFVDGAIRGRSLRGSALLADGAPVGFGFFTVEVDRCLIGDLYVRPNARTPERHAALVDGLVKQIRQTRPRKRVESQSILFDDRGYDEAFAAHGFDRYERRYLVVELDPSSPPRVAPHSGVDVRSWTDADFPSAIELVFDAYRGTVDAKLNVQYRSREGCADLLDALTDSVWCGAFEPSIARVALDATTGRRCGVAIASAIGRDTLHFAQISVAPTHQNRGVGRAMITAALADAAAAGYARATLAVTADNVAAAKLYADLGFEPSLTFPVFARPVAPFRLRAG